MCFQVASLSQVPNLDKLVRITYSCSIHPHPPMPICSAKLKKDLNLSEFFTKFKVLALIH
jgi:hypothetical protein